MARTSKIVTILSGTPVQLATTQTLADRIFIQMLGSGSGIGYVMEAPAGVTPSPVSGQLIAEMAPGAGTLPGGSYSDIVPGGGSGIDVSNLWVDGTHTGDQVNVSYNQR